MAGFKCVLETALLVRAALGSLRIQSYPKTTGSKGIHIYVPNICTDRACHLQKQVWTWAKELAKLLAPASPRLVTADYKVAKRSKGRVLVSCSRRGSTNISNLV